MCVCGGGGVVYGYNFPNHQLLIIADIHLSSFKDTSLSVDLLD